jgi:hypothetical protein
MPVAVGGSAEEHGRAACAALTRPARNAADVPASPLIILLSHLAHPAVTANAVCVRNRDGYDR